MAEIPVGAAREEQVLVTTDIAVDFLGSEDARVLGTPFMIAHMEITSRNLIKGFLEDGFDTVGTQVNVRHLAASPIGMSVRFRAEILEVQDRRVLCKVEAHDEKEKIGEGTHERAVIHVAKFAERLKRKIAG